MRVRNVRIKGDFQQKKGVYLSRMLGSLERGGIRVATVAAQIAPRRTGLLASTITATPPESAQGTGANHFKVRVGPLVYYGPFQELGTDKMQAQPYLRPALGLLRAHLVRQMARDVIGGEND